MWSESKLYQIQRSPLWLRAVKKSNHRRFFPRPFYFSLFFFKTIFPSKTQVMLVLYLYAKISCPSPGREREKELERSPIPPIHPPAFLIGLLHLLRSTNCLLGMLQLKHPIKRTHTSGTVFLESCHARHRKSSLYICVMYNQKSSSIQPGDK